MSVIVAPDWVSLAGSLADLARPIIRRHFRTPLEVVRKSDSSPVTIADREVERQMREKLAETVPQHGILGEEFGAHQMSSDYIWVLDPIDGTKAFIAGKPTFGTLISLFYKQRPVLGIIDQAITGERWIGALDRPTTHNGTPVRVRACEEVARSVLFTTDPDLFSGTEAVKFRRLKARVRQPMYGCDCYAYGLLALGYADLVVESSLKAYDFGALVPVVTGAGGAMTDWRGEPVTLGSAGDVLAAGDHRCHADALALLA